MMELPGTTSVAETTATTSPASMARGSQRNRQWGGALTNWLGFVPFALFCLLFEILPAIMVIEGSFTDSDSGAFTLNNYQRIFSQASNLHAFQTSIVLSLVATVISAVCGFFAAYGLYQLKINWIRNIVIAFSSIAANFAGVPLAFAFVSTLGVTGFVTVFLLNWFHIDLYHTLNFSVYSFWGLVLTYSYFELPLMILITLPALDALRPQWHEAATSLGASNLTYWYRIALPILLPSLVAAVMLLFANAFAAFATAYALAQGAINLVPILISFVVNGNVDLDTGLGDALAVGMIIVLLIAFACYTAMLRRVSKWQGK